MSKRIPELPPDLLRRRLLGGSAAVVGLSWLELNWPLVARAAEAAVAAMDAGAGFAHLDAADAADLEAIAARIIPTDDAPGAREAGVVWFIDQAIGGFLAEAAPGLLAGLAEFNAGAVAGTQYTRFAQLPVEGQDAALTAAQDGEFFGFIRFLTIAGMFALPSHGGNRDQVGWKLIGFDHRHVWAPPFGHYDARVPGGGDGDE